MSLQKGIDRDREKMRAYAAQMGVVNRRLGRVAFTDALTLLPNRMSGMRRLEVEWASSVEHDTPLCCMLGDLDHFKEINDTYGHEAGDKALREAAAILKNKVRGTDLVCRFGGEEFVVICPGTTLAEAQDLGERLREAIEEHTVKGERYTCSITLSVGITERRIEHKDPDDLLREADRALYVAKARGRNRVVTSAELSGVTRVR